MTFYVPAHDGMVRDFVNDEDDPETIIGFAPDSGTEDLRGYRIVSMHHANGYNVNVALTIDGTETRGPNSGKTLRRTEPPLSATNGPADAPAPHPTAPSQPGEALRSPTAICVSFLHSMLEAAEEIFGPAATAEALADLAMQTDDAWLHIREHLRQEGWRGPA